MFCIDSTDMYTMPTEGGHNCASTSGKVDVGAISVVSEVGSPLSAATTSMSWVAADSINISGSLTIGYGAR